MSQEVKWKTKSSLDFYITKNWKFSCILHAHFQFLCSLARFDIENRGLRQPVQPACSTARIRRDINVASFFRCKLL